MQSEVIERDGHDDDGAERKQERGDRRQGEAQRDQGQLDKTALFFLFINDVEGVKDCLHSGIRAPQRDGKSGDKPKAKLRISLCSESIDLVPHDAHRALRQKTRDRRQMFVNGRGFGEKTIERHHGRDGGKDGEQPIKDDAGRHSQETVLSDPFVGPP